MSLLSSTSLGRSGRWLRWTAWLGIGALLPALWACTSRTFEAPVVTPTQVSTQTVTQKINNNVDVLFMIDDSSSMSSMQQKILMQLPTFMNVLENLPMGLPSVHIAVVSSDLGATSDGILMGCNNTGGDNGVFFSQPEGGCLGTTLTAGATFISDVDGTPNFTDPIAKVFQCIALLGQAGCGFEHQLASIDRALGGDGQPPPAQNADFLRKDAYLGIVLLTNEDDCSAAASGAPIPVFSLGAQSNDLSLADGPIGNYRCNGGPLGGHLCEDANGPNPGTPAQPPLTPPTDATTFGASTPILPLIQCASNDTGTSGLVPVKQFVEDIQRLKSDPANQILIGAIVAPTTPYVVEWLPQNGADNQKELWPTVMHSCGPPNISGADTAPGGVATSDDSFGDPPVRIAQWVNAFGKNGVLASICDSSYADSMTSIARKLGALIKPQCIQGMLQNDPSGNPNCTVVNNVTIGQTTTHVSLRNCAESNNAPPCWTLAPNADTCPGGGQALTVTADPKNPQPDSLDSTVECALCVPGIAAPGC